MDYTSEKVVTYSQFACIGAGFSGIGLGATLKRWYKNNDIVFFEKNEKLGGTWFINQYPGKSPTTDTTSQMLRLALYDWHFNLRSLNSRLTLCTNTRLRMRRPQRTL